MKTRKIVVKLGISVLIIAALIARMDRGTLSQIGESVHFSAWVLAAGALFLQLLALTIRWKDLLNLDQNRVRFGSSLKMIVASQLANTLLITTIGGMVVRIGLATQSGTTILHATCATITDRLMTLAALVTLAALALPYFNGLHHNPMLTAYLPVMIMAVISAFALSFLLLRRNLFDLFSGNAKIQACIQYIVALSRNVPLLGRILLMSLLGQICYFMAVYFIANSTDANLEFSKLFVVLPVIALIASLPISIGGWGIREGAFVYGLGLLGVPMETAFVISVQIGVVSLVATLLAGIPALLDAETREWIRKGPSSIARL